MNNQNNFQSSPEVDAPQAPPRQKASEQHPLNPALKYVHASNRHDEVLRTALERADRAMAMVQQMQENMQRSQRRMSIKEEVTENHSQRRRSARLLKQMFYGNFAVLAAVFYLGAGIHVGSPADILGTIARTAGLAGTYLLLIQLVLVARVPFLDKLYGMDRLTRWHKTNGHISIYLIIIHAIAAIVARAVAANMPVMDMASDVMLYRFMPEAVAGLGLMILAIVTSIVKVKRRIGFNRWQMIHVWTYLGVLLSFGHELFGPDFAHKPAAQGYIWLLYGATFTTLLFYRVFVPTSKTFRHQLRVSKVVEEGSGVVSIYMTGFNLQKLDAKPGQFFYWRFLTSSGWWESHPFSLSTAPNSKYLRITVKSLGDFSSGIDKMRIGTWVTFEGPFGGFTPERRTQFRTVLIAGGVGVTPIRSLLEGMKTAAGDMTVIYRSDRAEDAVLLEELQVLAERKKADLHLVLGPRTAYPADRQPLSSPHLRKLVPDIHRRDVYICASPGMTAALRATLKAMGLRSKQVHHETFA